MISVTVSCSGGTHEVVWFAGAKLPQVLEDVAQELGGLPKEFD
jgi:hypothetical protein